MTARHPVTAEHVLVNRAQWDEDAAWYEGPGRRSWSRDEPTWGTWGVPEVEVGMIPPDLDGRSVVELGCGTGYVSAWLARRGARPVGLDNSANQLRSARRFQQEFGLDFPLVHGDAEHLPFPDGSFDHAISEYGASIWCDPYHWIPEAARVLRPGGQLSFLCNHVFLMLFVDDDEDVPAHRDLQRPYFGLHRMEWPDDSLVEFHLPHGELLRLLRSCGFEIEDLRELQPSPDATTDYRYVSLDWARQWPSEEVWVVRKRR